MGNTEQNWSKDLNQGTLSKVTQSGNPATQPPHSFPPVIQQTGNPLTFSSLFSVRRVQQELHRAQQTFPHPTSNPPTKSPPASLPSSHLPTSVSQLPHLSPSCTSIHQRSYLPFPSHSHSLPSNPMPYYKLPNPSSVEQNAKESGAANDAKLASLSPLAPAAQTQSNPVYELPDEA
jgi:hypothetical protein